MKLKYIWLLILLALPSFAQQPQTQKAPSYSVNAAYVNGVAPGYSPTADKAGGPYLDLGPGTAFCGNTIAQYPGGIYQLTVNTTSYIYLDTNNACIPTVSTSTFTTTQLPIASVVVDSSGNISSITDVRTPFNSNAISGGYCPLTGCTFTGPITDSSGFIGPLTGNVIGNVTGNVTGNVVGNVTGFASLNVLKTGDTMTGPLSTPLINGVINPLGYAGVDICDKTNAAIVAAASPGFLQGGYGLVAMPPGNYTCSTSISLVGYQNVTLDCQGANIVYSGPSPAIDALQGAPGGSAEALGGIRNCNYFSPSPVTNMVVYRIGNIEGYRFENNSAYDFSATGNIGLLVTNTQYFTEESRIVGNRMKQVTVGYEFLKNCSGGGCTNSFEYTFFRNNYWNSPYVSVANASGILLSGGADLQNSLIEINANVNAPSGGTVLNVSGGSDAYLRNHTVLHAEGDGGPSTAICINNNGTFISSDGPVICDALTNSGSQPITVFGSEGGAIGNESNIIAQTSVVFKPTSPTVYGPFSSDMGATTLWTVPTGLGSWWFHVTCLPIVTTAATSTSTLPSCIVSWQDGFNGFNQTTQITATSSSNTVGTTGLSLNYFGGVDIFAVQGSIISLSTSGYATSGAVPMSFRVAASIDTKGH